MSTFLGFESFLIPLGASIEDVRTTIKNALTSYGWRVAYESVPLVSTLGTLGTVANAFLDNGQTSEASSTSALPLWVGVRTASSFTPTKMFISGLADPTRSPKDFQLQWSDDGASWTTLQSWTTEDKWGAYECRTYDVAGAAAHAYWRLNITAVNGSTTKGLHKWFLQDAAGRRTVSSVDLYMIPPVSETIGNAKSRDIVYIAFTSNAISVRPLMELLQTKKQAVTLWVANPETTTQGAVSCSVTINGVAVTGAAGNAASTARDNFRALFDALGSSADPSISAFDWSYEYKPQQNAGENYDYIYGIRKDAGSNYTIAAGANIGGANTSGNRQTPMTQFPGVNASPAYSVTTDLVNGFIYYLQVNSRGIALATKTNANYFGPVHACYANNDQAIASMPVDSVFCSPIELLVGTDAASTSMTSSAACSHSWAFHQFGNRGGVLYYSSDNYGPEPFGGHSPTRRFWDAKNGTIAAFNYAYGGTQIDLKGSALGSGTDAVFDDFQIHRQTMDGLYRPSSSAVYMNGTSTYGIGVAPILEPTDWYKFRGTATNESLLLIADTIVVTQLAQAMDHTTDYTTVDLVNASALPSSGFIIVEGEAIQYTGKSGNTITGCTRGRYATLKTAHLNGTTACLGLWFTVINGGALLAGYNKPS